MHRINAVIIAGAALVLTGCGAVMHGARQTIDVQSSPSGAKVETSPSVGTFTTPTTLNLERKNSYVLTFTSPGYAPATYNIHNSIGTGTVIADVLLTGLVGVVVDGLTGAWYGLSPETATVTMARVSGTGPETISIQVAESRGGHGFEIKTDLPVQVKVEQK